MKKRREKRIEKSLLVQISEDGFEQLGVTANISQNGMCIATTEILPAQSECCVWIAAGDNVYALKGQVVWNMKKEAVDADAVQAGIGIKINEAEPGYFHYIGAMMKKRLSRPGRPGIKKNPPGH